MAGRLGDDHMVDLAVLGQISDTALTRDTAIAMDAAGLPNTFVPGRNLLFFPDGRCRGLPARAAYAGGRHVRDGFSGYPDCRDDTSRRCRWRCRWAWASASPSKRR